MAEEAAMKVANAPVSWGVMEFEFEGRSDDYRSVLDQIDATGYQGTELGDWGFLPTDPVRLREELGRRELDLVAAFVPVNFRDQGDYGTGEAESLRVAQLMAEACPEGGPLLVLSDDNGRDPERTHLAGQVRPEHGLSEEEWRTFAEGVERIAARVWQETGLRSAFHHHCAGFVETPWEVAELMDRTSAELVGLCLDTGHYRFGGGDPAEGVDRYGERIWHVHLKDYSPAVAEQAAREGWDYFTAVERGVFCELGLGDVDFPTVLERLRGAGYDGWLVVEQDVLPGMGSPKESARRNRDYLAELGL